MAAGLSRTHGDDELRGADGEGGSYADGSYAAQEAEGVAGRFSGASGKFGSAGMMHSSLGGKGLTSTPEGLSVTPEASAMQDGVIIGGYDTQVSWAMPTRLSHDRLRRGGTAPAHTHAHATCLLQERLAEFFQSATLHGINSEDLGPSRAKSASRSLRRALLMPQVIPGHPIAAQGALKSSLWATPGEKGAEIGPKTILAGLTGDLGGGSSRGGSSRGAGSALGSRASARAHSAAAPPMARPSYHSRHPAALHPPCIIHVKL